MPALRHIRRKFQKRAYFHVSNAVTPVIEQSFARHGNTTATRRLGRQYPIYRILEYKALPWQHTEPGGTQKINFRVRFAVSHLIAGTHDIYRAAYAYPFYKIQILLGY